MGLLAIPFLLNDTASDKGCKWQAQAWSSAERRYLSNQRHSYAAWRDRV